ncbi:hypothetical protein SynRCC2555_01758 [Synechococcus sp. WH 8101]|nr:hypothetical protein SynRCC2555_01758 [Synechococcus sp. WH 8101]
MKVPTIWKSNQKLMTRKAQKRTPYERFLSEAQSLNMQ